MQVKMTRVMLYVQDVGCLKSFYHEHFGFSVVEEIESEWVVLNAGAIELALHRVGPAYCGVSGGSNSSNVKMVFTMQSELTSLRDRLIAAGVAMRELKRFEGFPYLLCDGVDPEGNVFQLLQPD